MKNKALKWIWPVLLTIGMAVPAAAEVSIDEILRLHNAGLSVQSLLLVVEASDTPDTISTDQLTALLEAGVPDTVITVLVYQADAVAEDWQPVDVDAGVEEYRVVTRTRYVDHYYDYYDPGWTFSVGVWWGNPYYWSYWDRPLYCDPWYDPWYGGWCATSWYSYGPGYYDPWYYRPRIFAGFGWFPFRYAWNPHYYGYHHGGYYAYYDHDYDDRGIFGRLRDESRADYRHTVNRSIVEGRDDKTFRGTTTDRRRDAPLNAVSHGTTRPAKGVGTDGRTALRDVNDVRKRAERDISKRSIDGRTLDVGTKGDKTTGRYDRKTEDRALKSYVDQKTGDTRIDKGKASGKTLRTDRASLFDRYGDEAKSNAEKVERYRAMKEAERKVTRTEARSTGRTTAQPNRSNPDAGTALRSFPGSRGDAKAKVTRRATPPAAAPAPAGRTPSRVDTKKKAEQKSEPVVAPRTRQSASSKMTPGAGPRGASTRDSGGRTAQTGSKRSGSTSEGKSRSGKP